MYAIIKTGGKQYRVEVGDKIDVEQLPSAIGDQVTLSDVLMVENDGKFSFGSPLVKGASIVAKYGVRSRSLQSLSVCRCASSAPLAEVRIAVTWIRTLD